MLKKSPKDAFLNYAAALEFRKKDDLKTARFHFEQILKYTPDYLAVYYQLGKLYENVDEIDLAIKTYRKGKEVAREQKDEKTIGELSEALMFLDEDALNY